MDGILPKRQGKSLSKRRLVAKSPEIWRFSLQLEEDEEISKLIHPAFLTQYKACLTEDDDNCLWNAICLCLGYDERDQIYLREKTAKIIQKHSSHFEQLLAEHMSGLNVKNLVDTCNQSGRPEGWATEFHILATAILLQRNIYVYSRFKKDANDKMYQDENWDAIKLADHFRNKGSFTIQHCNYQPRKGSFRKKTFVHILQWKSLHRLTTQSERSHLFSTALYQFEQYFCLRCRHGNRPVLIR